jgi:hypothetical protein
MVMGIHLTSAVAPEQCLGGDLGLQVAGFDRPSYRLGREAMLN